MDLGFLQTSQAGAKPFDLVFASVITDCVTDLDPAAAAVLLQLDSYARPLEIIGVN